MGGGAGLRKNVFQEHLRRSRLPFLPPLPLPFPFDVPLPSQPASQRLPPHVAYASKNVLAFEEWPTQAPIYAQGHYFVTPVARSRITTPKT